MRGGVSELVLQGIRGRWMIDERDGVVHILEPASSTARNGGDRGRLQCVATAGLASYLTSMRHRTTPDGGGRGRQR